MTFSMIKLLVIICHEFYEDLIKEDLIIFHSDH